MPPKQSRRSAKNNQDGNDPASQGEEADIARKLQTFQLTKEVKRRSETTKKAQQISSAYTASIKNLIAETQSELDDAYADFQAEQETTKKEIQKIQKDLKYKLNNYHNDFQGSSKILITSIQEKVSSRMVKAGDDLEGLLEEERAGAVEVEKMIGKDQSNVGKV